MELSSSQLELDQRYCREAMEIWTPYSLVYIICVTELSTIIEERDPPTQSSKMNIVPVPKCHVVL